MKNIRYIQLCVLLTVACLMGCKQPEVVEKEDPTLAVSEFPIRVWIASQVSDIPIIQRQWQARSEQPIEIKQVRVEDLLGKENPEADVIVFPARLIGDLIAKGAIQHIPENATKTDEGDETLPASAAERTQAQFARRMYGASLGCSVPVAIASNRLAEQVGTPLKWDSLLGRLETGSAGEWPAEVDHNALVDRYLFVLGTLMEKNPTYGLLFEVVKMKSRLKAPEFLRACEVLKRLVEQPGGRAPFLSSHSDAWIWAAKNEASVVGIACPAELSGEASAVKEGAVLDIEHANLIGWNTGGGLVASLSSTCQQTSHSLEVLKWLQDGQTRSVVAPLVNGIEAEQSDVELLTWKARDASRAAFDSDTLPFEPSLPHALDYRAALAKELLAFLRGDITADQAMSNTDEAWQGISGDDLETLSRAYERSLGL